MKTTALVFVGAMFCVSSAFASDELLDELESAIDSENEVVIPVDDRSFSAIENVSERGLAQHPASIDRKSTEFENSESWSHLWE